MKSVVVLLSSYNGEQYIKEQIESIFNQKDVDVYLMIRDDGSTDKTVEIIEEMSFDKKIKLIKGENIGYIKSFDYLIRYAPQADFYAYADQDDVWMDDKLKKAIEQIEGDYPMLYAGNAYVTDDKLNKKGLFNKREENYFDHICKILNSGAQGCTLVFNEALRKNVNKYYPINIWPHDYWLTTLCLFIGQVKYDPEPHMLYRQHSFNVTGGDLGFQNKIRKSKDSLKRSFTAPWSRLAEDLLEGYSDLISEKDQKVLKELVLYKRSVENKVKLLFDPNFKKENWVKNIFLKFLILFNRV